MKPNWIIPGWLVEFILWLGEAALDRITGRPSSRKIVALMTATALTIGAMALLLAKAYWVYKNGGDIALELGAVTVPLCTLAGFNYSAKLKSEQPPPTSASE